MSRPVATALQAVFPRHKIISDVALLKFAVRTSDEPMRTITPPRQPITHTVCHLSRFHPCSPSWTLRKKNVPNTWSRQLARSRLTKTMITIAKMINEPGLGL
jgi:hypothetical protein